jgi:hypothetical protein
LHASGKIYRPIWRVRPAVPRDCHHPLISSNKKLKKIISHLRSTTRTDASPSIRAGGEDQVSTTPAFASAIQALDMLDGALAYLSAADPTQMPAVIQAQALTTLERADARTTAARAAILAAFTASQGYCDDGDYGPRSWLIHRTRVTKGTATSHTGWARRARTHPRVLAALAAGDLSQSYARVICGWTDRLPGDCLDNADAILVAAAEMGMDLRDLAALAAEIEARSRPDAPDEDGPRFEDRAVKLETTFGGAGVMTGDLSPECAAVVTAVLDALSAPQGAEDDRSHAQRYHDALQEACRRLVAADLLPERAGQPVKIWAHIHLADLLDLDTDSELQKEWTGRVRRQWAAARAAASVSGSDGSAWLEGDAAEGFACDASVTPVVLGTVNPGVLDDLVRFCLDLAGHGPGRCTPGGHGHLDHPDPGQPDHSGPDPGAPDPGPGGPDRTASDPGGPGEHLPAPQPLPPGLSRESLEQRIIGAAVALVSGPGGLASFLRRRQLGARLGGPSQPLDVGYSDDVPAAIRNAVKLRDQHCQWAGGCHQPASACQVHHVKHKGHGGKTSLDNCILLCSYHHQQVIHRMGWTLVRNPDGTTTAWNRDRTKVLRSHSPPARAG